MTAPSPTALRARTVGAALVTVLVVGFVAGCTSSSTGTTRHSGHPDSVQPSSGAASNSSSGSPTGSATRSASPTATRPTSSPTGLVPSHAVPTRPPVPIKSVADFGGGVRARILGYRFVDGKARLPGEISGPSVAFTLAVTNDGNRARAVVPVVNLFVGPDLTPALTLSGPPTAPFPRRVAVGSTVRGVYTFNLRPADRGDVRLEFSFAPASAVVVFTGSLR